MTQEDRDRLVALQKAKDGLITHKEAAAEIGQSERHVRRLVKKLKGKGDAVVVHGLRGRRSNRKIDDKVKQAAIRVLSDKVYAGFGPTLAAEYLAEKHGIQAGRETVRGWMVEGKLWQAKRQRIEKIHEWRQRRSRVGELVQWDTSEHAGGETEERYRNGTGRIEAEDEIRAEIRYSNWGWKVRGGTRSSQIAIAGRIDCDSGCANRGVGLAEVSQIESLRTGGSKFCREEPGRAHYGNTIWEESAARHRRIAAEKIHVARRILGHEKLINRSVVAPDLSRPEER